MKKVKLLFLLILILSCSMNAYASEWMESPIVSDVEDVQWDRNQDGIIDTREANLRDAAMQKAKEKIEDFATDETVTIITSNRSASILNTVCYLAGTLLLIVSIVISILYLADYVSDGKYCILSRLTKQELHYEDKNIIAFLCKMLFTSVLGIFIANGTFQRGLSNLYAFILEYFN